MQKFAAVSWFKPLFTRTFRFVPDKLQKIIVLAKILLKTRGPHTIP